MKMREKRAYDKSWFHHIAWSWLIIVMGVSCAPTPTIPQQDREAWHGVSVVELDAHHFFEKMPMFRTMRENGTEIRNYALGYDFGECFGEAGGKTFGDFVNENDFINCSSSRIVCNNLFYIKEEQVLEYVPTGRCNANTNVLPKSQELEIVGE